MRPSIPMAALAASLIPLSPVVADEATDLEPVVVTATRTAEPENQTLASVSVIDREAIDRLQPRSVPDLLRGLAGVAVSTSGGPGQPSSVFLRGTNSDQVLVLIDGMKVGSATLGTVPFEDLPVDQIDRIEVVRGPGSSLYGSEAIGGVIQIFTRKGGGETSLRGSLGGGSYSTGFGSVGASGGGENGWWSLDGNVQTTAGFNACNGRPDPFAGCGVYQPDRDGYTNTGLSARAGYRFGDRASIDLHLLQSNNRTDFDGDAYSGNSSRAEQQVLGATVRLKPLDPWTLTLSGGQTTDHSRIYYNDAFIDRFDTDRDLFTLQNDWSIAKGQLATLGLDYQNDSVNGTVGYTADSRDDLGVFGEYQGSLGPASTKLSLRQDNNSQFGDHATGRAALGWLFDAGVRTVLSYGTAFKAPTFNDLYYPGFGNPNLQPEESASAELAVDGRLGTGHWSLSLYRTSIDQLIAFDPTVNQAANIDQALIRGLELTANGTLQDWRWGLTGTLLNPQNESDGPDHGNILPRRPEQMAQLTLDRDWGRWSAGATVYWSGQSYDDLANTTTLDPYTLVGLRGEYRLSAGLALQARIENLLDQHYETAAFYNNPGRSAYLTLRYSPR